MRLSLRNIGALGEILIRRFCFESGNGKIEPRSACKPNSAELMRDGNRRSFNNVAHRLPADVGSR
jgi:hypothetical protein